MNVNYFTERARAINADKLATSTVDRVNGRADFILREHAMTLITALRQLKVAAGDGEGYDYLCREATEALKAIENHVKQSKIHL
jgi:hypothetical protein